MKTWMAVSSLVVALTVLATPVLAQTTPAKDADPTNLEQKKKGSKNARTPSTTQTGGTTKPSAVDPAQAHKTGANAGEGAAYSRSTEKGNSTVKETDKSK